MLRQRSLVDYALAKRAALADLFAGRVGAAEVCDAHPYLLRAAKYHGEATDKTCPVCKGRDPLTHVTYVYGDELKDSSGQVRATADLPELARRHQELAVYVVEVCRRCGWNHLDTSYLVGGAGAPGRRRGASTAR